MACPETGANVERQVISFSCPCSSPTLLPLFFADPAANFCSQIVRMFEAYLQDNKYADFKFLHVFTRIEMCEKWREVHLTLAKGKDGIYNPDAPAPGAAERHPDGNKKTKAAKNAAPTVEML